MLTFLQVARQIANDPPRALTEIDEKRFEKAVDAYGAALEDFPGMRWIDVTIETWARILESGLEDEFCMGCAWDSMVKHSISEAFGVDRYSTAYSRQVCEHVKALLGELDTNPENCGLGKAFRVTGKSMLGQIEKYRG